MESRSLAATLRALALILTWTFKPESRRTRNFDDATFDRSAGAFENPDHVAIASHNYRWRLGLADGESKYDDLEKRLAESPLITVPTITMEGDANVDAY